jgi:hypothetical protein
LIKKRPKAYFNRYPGFEFLARKKELSLILSRMSKYFPEHFDYVPKEYLLPEESDKLKERIEGDTKKWWIAKPSKGCGGDGIFLHRGTFPTFPSDNNDFVIQEYIDNPLLLDQKKFDLRIYVLVSKLDPLECYYCNEGLVRLCTQTYVKPTLKNCKEMCMHLTNYSMNKNSEQYIEADLPNSENEFGEDATKRLFTKVQ